MKAIMVMYDSLRRDLMSVYGGPVPTPNFERLAAHSVRFDASYVGSLPCMPARRELQTGRYNFLHRSWGPMEPFDDSMPELLKKTGIHSRIATDHYHYVEDGGCTYHSRYSAWSCYRGQESDTWVSDLTPHGDTFARNQLSAEYSTGTLREMRKKGGWQNLSNRTRLHTEADFPMSMTFADGIDFLQRNGRYDNWFLQIETFDPHEPFTSPASWFDPDTAGQADWPPYDRVREDAKDVDSMRQKYVASLRFCDRQLGRVLDEMDEQDLWKDTMLIVNTDHGFFLAEHDYWGKGGCPNYEELVHTPLFIWDPRSGRRGVNCPALVQTIDLAPTILDFFGLEIPADMLGKPLTRTLADDTPVHEYGLFGYHGMPIGITDGRYTLLHNVQDFDEQVYEYTLMPTHMRAMFSVEELRTATMAKPFRFTKGAPVMKIEARLNPRFLRTLPDGDLLFDVIEDPHQEHPIDDPARISKMLDAMVRLFDENDAPEELYRRYGLK